MKRNLIKFLAREYPLATSDEIAEALKISSGKVRHELYGHARRGINDIREYNRRKRFEPCQDTVRIMKRRLAERQQVAA